VRAELDEEAEDLVEHLVAARVGPVDLVDHHERAQTVLEGLAQHEPRLRHRALGRVDEEEHRVRHPQRPLDLSAEVGVAGRVDDVDPRPVPVDRRVLRQDRDAALALLRVGIHRPLLDLLVLPEGPAKRNIASTRVVLPWSTCATMAMLRIGWWLLRDMGR
jgi:hypothetical protein